MANETDIPTSCQELPVFREGENSDEYMRENLLYLRRREADQKALAERKWSAPSKAPKPQQPCDIGLFSDEMDQVEMFMDPTND